MSSLSPKEEKTPDQKKVFSPREFLRRRRPERFSDSVIEEHTALDRSILEYHLDTLTNRSQESDFERFACALIEREICPNLLPQTGPTGGGDSKVDAETYPVADELALLWYVGIGREASSERWGFAFSTKKDWRPKIRSDVEKLVATNRGYKKAFFVTNQYVRDKLRAEIEDELRDKYSIDVRILDRTWILDRVFKDNHEVLTVEKLGLSIATRKEVRKGPLDVQREQELEEVENRIESANQEGQLGVQLVDDCIEAALVSRSLDLPRTEVEGRFLRAQRVAQETGTAHQHLIVTYQWAWTTFWWYEDYKRFEKLYESVEEQAIGTKNVYELELLTNLWYLLTSLDHSGELDDPDEKLENRTKALLDELERLSNEPERPSAALQARTLRSLMQLLLSEPTGIDPLLKDLQEIVKQSEGLIGYPLEPLVEFFMELGDFLGDQPTYEEVFETILEVASARKEEISAASMLTKRGVQQLERNRPYDAIRFIGRALSRLYKYESRDQAIHALYLCGCAYQQVGLTWAARGSLLSAASIATNEFWTHQDITPLQAVCYNRIKWLELQLGRLPHLLAWHELDSTVKPILQSQGYNLGPLADDETFDAILGMLLLKTDIWELKRLSGLPDVLEKEGLHLSSVALRYALGHDESLPEELVGDLTDRDSIYEFFIRWRDQPAANDLPVAPLLCAERTIKITSMVLGCRITVESDNVSPCVELSESVLAALESLLSTAMAQRVAPREPTLSIRIRQSDFAERPFGFSLDDSDGRPHVDIQCSTFNPASMSLDKQAKIKEKLTDLLAHCLARVFFIESEEVIARLFRDELALERAISFTSSFVVLGNVLGHTTKTKISDWSHSDAHNYPVKRSQPWDTEDRQTKSASDQSPQSSPLKIGKGDPPQELLDLERTKHTDIEVTSLIRESLWNKAGWKGVLYMWIPQRSAPPVFALMFGNGKAAQRIFEHWREELGAVDKEGQLRISIIRGINEDYPHNYRVVIGTNIASGFSRPDIRLAITMSRIHTMEPPSGKNLDGFLQRYQAVGSYILSYAIQPDSLSSPKPVLKHAIEKRHLYIREAWEIERHDSDSVGININDKPIIPSGKENPPVFDLLRWKRENLKD